MPLTQLENLLENLTVMLPTVIIQLRDRQSQDTLTDPLQIDPTMDTDGLSMYLNTALGKESRYLFYHADKRIITTVEDAMNRAELGTEAVITIDYVDIKNQVEDSSAFLEDVITGLAYFGGRLYALLYGGSLVDVQMGSILADNVTGIACDTSMYWISGTKLMGVVDAAQDPVEANLPEGSNIPAEINVTTPTNPFHSLATNNSIIATGSEKKQITLICPEQTTIVYSEEPYRNLLLTANALYWVETLDVIVRSDIKTGKKRSHFAKHTVTAIAVENETIYAATSDGLLLVFSGTLAPEAFPVSLRAVDKVIIHGSVIFLVSQFAVVSICRTTFVEKACYAVEEQINAAVLSIDMLFIGCGSKVAGYKIDRFL